MTDSETPYEQGFRDALLTMKACLETLTAEERSSEQAKPALWAFQSQLGALIDQKNVDLWKLFAVARVDLSAYPEAEALRRMFRAPSGVLIDSLGRMLFVRLNGVDYETGVLGLLDQLRACSVAADERNARIAGLTAACAELREQNPRSSAASHADPPFSDQVASSLVENQGMDWALEDRAQSAEQDRFIDQWRDGDPSCHCTHCDVCGLLFRTGELSAHLRQAHLGGERQHREHWAEGCRLLVLLAAGIRPSGLGDWLRIEQRLRAVQESIEL